MYFEGSNTTRLFIFILFTLAISIIAVASNVKNTINEHDELGQQQDSTFADLTSELGRKSNENLKAQNEYQQVQKSALFGQGFDGYLIGSPFILESYYIAVDNAVIILGITVLVIITIILRVSRSHKSNQTPIYNPRIPYPEKCTFDRDIVTEDLALSRKHNFPIGCDVLTSKGLGSITQLLDSGSYEVKYKDGNQCEIGEADVSTPKVTALYIYPIKSCKGIKVDEATVSARGFQYDRHWMITDASGRFMSQRKTPEMTHIIPKLSYQDASKGITLTANGMKDLYVPLVQSSKAIVDVSVFRSKIKAIDQGDEAASWIQKFLGVKGLRFVAVKEDYVRPTDPKHAPGYQTSFADGFPYLLVAEESLSELQERVGDKSLSLERFRPNIVVSGCPPFADDKWSSIQIGNVRLRNVKPCSRCKLPTNDPESGKFDVRDEPTKTLKEFRLGKHLGMAKKFSNERFFGNNLVSDNFGVISIGTSVKVLTARKYPFGKTPSGTDIL